MTLHRNISLAFIIVFSIPLHGANTSADGTRVAKLTGYRVAINQDGTQKAALHEDNEDAHTVVFAPARNSTQVLMFNISAKKLQVDANTRMFFDPTNTLFVIGDAQRTNDKGEKLFDQHIVYNPTGKRKKAYQQITEAQLQAYFKDNTSSSSASAASSSSSSSQS